MNNTQDATTLMSNVAKVEVTRRTAAISNCDRCDLRAQYMVDEYLPALGENHYERHFLCAAHTRTEVAKVI